MQLVVGLGNPGRRYCHNRHNIGFQCLEALARELGFAFAEETPQYRLAGGNGPGGPVTLLEPLTYMNRSGDAVLAWARRSGVSVGQTAEETGVDGSSLVAPDVVPIVVCDDLNLPLGSIRIRTRGRDGGQNGLASVIAAAGGEGVPRLRLGVGPLAETLPPEVWADYVLHDFDPTESESAADLVQRGAAALSDLLALGPAAAASRHNRRIRVDQDLPENG